MSSAEKKKERKRVVKIRRDRDGRREIWFRNKNRILGITRIGEAIWSPSGAKWVVGGRGGVAGGREEGEEREGEETYRYGEALRQRNTEERIIAGKPTTLRPNIPARPPSLPPAHLLFLAILARRSHYLLLEETFCSQHSVILRTVRLLRTDWRREIAAAIRDSRHPCGSNHSRDACNERIVSNLPLCMNIYHLYEILICSKTEILNKWRIENYTINIFLNLLFQILKYMYRYIEHISNNVKKCEL